MISTHMRIFRLPALLNAFRGNVLDICSRFRFSPFFDPIRFRCAVPLCSQLLATLRLASSRFPSRLISSRLVWRPAFVPPLSTLLSPLCLFPSALPSDRPVAAIIAPPARVARSRGLAERTIAIRCVHSLAGIRRILSACLTRPVHRVAERGAGGEGEPCPCRLRVCAVSV